MLREAGIGPERVSHVFHGTTVATNIVIEHNGANVGMITTKGYRDIIHIAIWPKDGDTSFYTMVYQDGATGKAFAKKFQIGGLSRDKLYPLAKTEGSKLIWMDVAE